jgi:hypothetical protein
MKIAFTLFLLASLESAASKPVEQRQGSSVKSSPGINKVRALEYAETRKRLKELLEGDVEDNTFGSGRLAQDADTDFIKQDGISDAPSDMPSMAPTEAPTRDDLRRDGPVAEPTSSAIPLMLSPISVMTAVVGSLYLIA